jgi:excisionase family DNA binding protein
LLARNIPCNRIGPDSLTDLQQIDRFHTQRDPAMEKLLSTYEPLLTTAAVAKWLGVSTRAVCLWAECKELPAIKIGRQWRFRQDELSEWLRTPRAEKVKNDPNNSRATVQI